jgi:hypothetical protein
MTPATIARHARTMREREELAKQLADAITITIQISPPGTRSEMGVSLGASDDGDATYTKSEADYRPSSDADRRCGTCNHFDDGACEIVSGKIDEDDICNYWTDGIATETASNAPDA